MSDWRTIDSAPKDGTPFLVWRESNNTVCQVQHFDAFGRDDQVIEPYSGKFWKATHWMPLPSPPGSDHDGSR